MRSVVWLRLCLAAWAGVMVPTKAAAQEDPNAAIKAETDRLKAEKDRITAQADLERARVTALGLPSYEGTTKLNPGAGEMEAMLLTAPAVRLAGQTIADRIDGSEPVLLLTREDPTDFGVLGATRAEIDGLLRQYKALGFTPGQPLPPNGAPNTGTQGFMGASGAVAILSAIGGLVRSDTEVTAAAVPVTSAMLLTAVASQLKERARLPSAALAPIDAAASPLLKDLDRLAEMDAAARQERDTLSKKRAGKPNAVEKTRIAAIDAVRKRYESFFARITTADANGAVPIARAARLDMLLAGTSGVLRVAVEKSGGSLINSKNITTFFGADPVRVSGGLVASYLLTSPQTGAVQNAGIIHCRTDLARLRAIQEGRVRYRSNTTSNARTSPTPAFAAGDPDAGKAFCSG